MNAAHLDYDALADLAEGILDDATVMTAREHLAVCADCQERAAEVAEVSRVLAEAPIPPMPAHLMDRLDAAIAAEAESRSATSARTPRRFQLLAAAAAAVVAVGGGAVVARTVLYDQGSDRTVGIRPPVEEPSRSTPAGSRPRPEMAGPMPYSVRRSGTKYTAQHLDAQVRAALSAHTSTPHHSMSTLDAVLDKCVTRVRHQKMPLLVDSATYDGHPATIIVLPGHNAAYADVWIVGAACSAHHTDLLAHRQIGR